MSDNLDTFFQTLSDSNNDSLLSIYDNKTFDDLVNERLDMKLPIDNVKEEDSDEEECDEGKKTFMTLLQNAKRDLKEDILLYNKLKDEEERLQNLLSTLYEVYHDSNNKLDFISVSVINDDVKEISTPLIDSFKTYYEKMCELLENDKQKNDKLLQDCKKKIKKSIYLYSYTKINSNTHSCPICLSKEVEQFCDPCGHCYCNSCLKSQYCYICRVKVKQIHRLFF